MIRTGDILITFTVTLTMLILVVCRTPVIYELSYMTLLFISSHSSMDKAPAGSGGHMYGLLTKSEVKMAGYWPSSFFACLWTETKSRSINSQRKNEANIQP